MPAVNPARLSHALTAACKATIAAEPDITKWDIQTGDGDCGEAVVGMCTSILTSLDVGLCSSPPLFPILDSISEGIEEIGGTLGAIISILLASFTSSLKTAYAANPYETVDEQILAKAAGEALGNLMTYTGARVGGRTVMDALIPFCKEFEQSHDLRKAAVEAERGAKTTEGMAAKFGRATYVGERKDAGTVPMDPGAWAAAVFLQGLSRGFDN